MWGDKVDSYKDVTEVFLNYISGKIRKYPFSDGSLQSETQNILTPLTAMNQNKLFSINSQPKCSGVPSTDVKFGWGPKHGLVFQKAYYEFFIPPELLEPLTKHLNKHEMITY